MAEKNRDCSSITEQIILNPRDHNELHNVQICQLQHLG